MRTVLIVVFISILYESDRCLGEDINDSPPPNPAIPPEKSPPVDQPSPTNRAAQDNKNKPGEATNSKSGTGNDEVDQNEKSPSKPVVPTSEVTQTSETTQTDQTTQANETTQTNETTQPNQTTQANQTTQTNQILIQPTDATTTTVSRMVEADNSEEIDVENYGVKFGAPRARSAVEEDSKKYKPVSEKIPTLQYNNSFVVYGMINSLGDQLDISYIGEPFDLTIIERDNFSSATFNASNKLFEFTNITSIKNDSSSASKIFRNTFSCTFLRELEINLDMVPDHLILQGGYSVQDKETLHKTSGTFTFQQKRGMFSYKIPYQVGMEVAKIDLKKYGDLIYDEGQVKLQRVCENQCELLASSAGMYSEIKSEVLNKVNDSLIRKRIEEFGNAFPFLSTCLSPPTKTPQYFVINKTSSIDSWRLSKLLLGPMIIKGLDNYTWSHVIASKQKSKNKTTEFRLMVKTGLVLGECDWNYMENYSNKSTENYSFTFIIDEVNFNMSLVFKEKWYVDDLHVQVEDIIIHRLNKSHPKIHEFTKAILREYVNETIETSLRELFSKLLPIMEGNKAKTDNQGGITLLTTQSNTQANHGHGNVTQDTSSPKTRTVPGKCQDNRSLFKRILFFWRKNEC